MKIDLAIFDLAGTTVKDKRDVQRVLQRTLSKFDIFITLEEADEVMGIPKPVAIHHLMEKYDETLNPLTLDEVDIVHQTFVNDIIEFYRTDATVEEAEGVSDTFRILKENGVKIAIDTGFDRPTTQALLKRLQWKEKGLIDFSVTSDEVPRGRPFPDMIRKAMQVMRLTDPQRVLKVGDTIFDLQEGNAAECGLVMGITTGAYSRERLMEEKHTHIIDSIPQILPILSFTNISQEA